MLSKSGDIQAEAREILTRSFVDSTQSFFHYVPRGDAMASEREFHAAYEKLVALTDGFADIGHEKLRAALATEPSTLAPLRMILGFTYNELAWAMKLTQLETTTRGDTLKRFERNPSPRRATPRDLAMIDTLVTTVLAIMGGEVLQIPPAAQPFFHSKLDKRDTRDGWDTVAADAGGVPYSALLYQRYVGGVWRQVQDAYSEVKGDRLLEKPLANLLDSHGISYYRSGSGATGAARTAERFGLSPGPDFALPEQSPTVVIESKVGEDGGTVRDKAARIKNMADMARARGLLACAVVDGRGWSERIHALADVVIATEGRTYSLATLEHLLEIPEISALRTTARS